MLNVTYFAITRDGIKYEGNTKPDVKIKTFCKSIHKGLKFFNAYAPPNTSPLVCVSGDNYSNLCLITTADRRRKETRIHAFDKDDVCHVLSLMALHSWNITAKPSETGLMTTLFSELNATDSPQQDTADTPQPKISRQTTPEER